MQDKKNNKHIIVKIITNTIFKLRCNLDEVGLTAS